MLDPMGSYMEVLVDCFGSKMNETNKILKEHYQVDMSFKEALGLTVKAILKEEKRKPEEITVTVIETETKRFRKITLDEIKKSVDNLKIHHPKFFIRYGSHFDFIVWFRCF